MLRPGIQITVVLFLAILLSSAVTAKDDFFAAVPADALFCIRLNNLDTSVGNLDQFLAGVAPVPPLAITVRMKLAEAMGDASLPGIDTTGAFGIFGIAKDADSEPQVFLAVPVSDKKALMSSPAVAAAGADGIATITSKTMYGEEKIAMLPMDGFALLCPDEQREQLAALAKPAVAGFSQSLAAAEKTAAEKSPLWVRVNLAKVNSLYGEQIAESLKELENMPVAMAGAAPGANVFMAGYANAIKALLKQSQAADIMLAPKADSLTLSMMLVPSAGSELAANLSLGPAPKASPELLGYLEDGAMANFYARINKPLLKKAYAAFFDMFSTGQSAEDIEKAKALVNKAIDSCGDTFAGTMKGVSGGKPPFTVNYIAQIKDAKAMKECTKEAMDIMNKGMFAKMYKDMGMTVTAAYTPAASTQNGIAIDTWAMTMKSADANSPEGKMIESMYGSGMTGYVAFTDTLALSCAGAGAEANVKQMIDAVKSGSTKPGSSEFRAALAMLPDAANADLICTYNYLRIFKSFTGLLPIPGMAQAFANMPESKSNLALAIRASGGNLSMDIVLPKEHAKEIMSAIQQMQGGGSQPQMMPRPQNGKTSEKGNLPD